MFIHRKIDEIKPRGSWVSDLWQDALRFVKSTSSRSLTSSQSFKHVERMRQRALKAVLSSLFEVVKSYEDHVIQQDLFEGSEKVDLGKGKYHTWQAIPRLARQSLLCKRMRSDGSAEESSSDDSRSDKPKAASSTTQLETSSPQAPTGASNQIVASNGSHGSIERQQGPPSQSSLATTASSLNYSKDSHPLSKAEIPLHGSHSAYYGLKMGIKEAMEGAQAQTQTPYEILPHGPRLTYDGFATNFEGSPTQSVRSNGSEVLYSMGGLPYLTGIWNPRLTYSKYHVIDGCRCEPGTCYGSFDGSTYTSLDLC
jgi:hypothetical protein